MIYSIRICNVDSVHVGPFVTSVRHGGLYRELAQQMHCGYIKCDLLSSNAWRFQVLSATLSTLANQNFWKSKAPSGKNRSAGAFQPSDFLGLALSISAMPSSSSCE